MNKLPLLLLFLLLACSEGKSQIQDTTFKFRTLTDAEKGVVTNWPSLYPTVDDYDPRMTSLANLWFYVERVDTAKDHLESRLTALEKQVQYLLRRVNELELEIKALKEPVIYHRDDYWNPTVPIEYDTIITVNPRTHKRDTVLRPLRPI